MDENVEQVCRTHAKLLCKLGGDFQCLWQVDPTLESIREQGYFFAVSMVIWRQLGLIITPKARIFEDHVIDSMQDLNVLGDNTKYFIELSHQYGERQDRRKQGIRYYKQKHQSQHKAELRESYPQVQELKEKMRAKRNLCVTKKSTKESIEEKNFFRSAELKNNNIILSFQS